MKRILGLDLGTTSIGWAYVLEAENENEKSSIIKLGVRVVPLTTDEESDFQKGKSISINANRTLKRRARRNLNRYQDRRKALIEILKKNEFINENSKLNEDGKNSSFSTYELRAKAVHENISKEELTRVLLMINKKRGYKSSRKVKTDEEGMAVDGMQVASFIYENNLTPGQYSLNLLKADKKDLPDYYRSDLQSEFEKIWKVQKRFYPEILTDELKEELKDKNKVQTWKICENPFGIVGEKLSGTAKEKKLQVYKWRDNGLFEKLNLEHLAIVLQEINNQIHKSSGYLGEISDRSKILILERITVGEFQYNQLKNNRHNRLKNQVFYRQDYLDEFESIWEKQKRFHPELTEKLKSEIRDVIIFFQRRLKSQKHLIGECEFEKYHKVVPKSSPLFQEFKIWQLINNIELRHLESRTVYRNNQIDIESKNLLFTELNIREKMTASEVLKFLVDKPEEFELNYKEGLDGNKTNAAFYKVYEKILKLEGEDYDFKKMRAEDINDVVVSKFAELGINQDILFLDTDIGNNYFDKQPLMQFWHLLYSFEGDDSRTGVEKLIKAITNKFGLKTEYAKLFANIPLHPDHGNLSSRAIRKIITFLKAGNSYDLACKYAGYNHSSSLSKEELEKRMLKDKMELLPKNSLRNPVVEKILNQLVNVVNAIIADENLGKPDEIRIELARDLKKSAKERENSTKAINAANKEHEEIRKILTQLYPFNKGVRITKNDIIKYKLYKELAPLGHKTVYTNTYIPLEKLFSKEFDIEHIIPQAVLFDDSFSNKTLATRDFNSREKANKTGIDAVVEKYGKDSWDYNRYIGNVEKLFNEKIITKAKYNKLLMPGNKIPEGFIERDLRNSQYIARKARQMLQEVIRTVNTTSGSVTSRLREDWQLINVMQELNWEKYNKLGLTYYELDKHGNSVPKITGWTKRNDHRHHAMDALTVAFTTFSHVQYLNNMNARRDETNDKFHTVYGIEQKYLYRNENSKLLFKPPLPINELRAEAKQHIENVLVSYKAKNKVVTRNKNKTKIKGKDNYKIKVELTPRGQLHNDSIYGKIDRYEMKYEKVGASFNEEKIALVANKQHREALLSRLRKFEGQAKKAFVGKNALSKNPVCFGNGKLFQVPEKVKLVWKSSRYTIRKGISSELKIDKVIDIGVQRILEKG